MLLDYNHSLRHGDTNEMLQVDLQAFQFRSRNIKNTDIGLVNNLVPQNL